MTKTKVRIDIDASLAKDNGCIGAHTPIKERIIHAIRQVYDPELPVNVYDLGLIYDIEEKEGDIVVNMTLTAPNCPVADLIPQNVAAAVRKVEGVKKVNVQLVWEPPWTQERMSEAAKLELGIF